MTSKGLELQFDEQMKKPEIKKVIEPEINENVEVKKVEDDEPKGFVLDDW
jgi:DNA mismatch repair protein MutS